MTDQNLVRGFVLALIALLFGLGAIRLPMGHLSHSGAGLFPLIVSSLLLLLSVLIIVRSRYSSHVPLDFNVKNIGIILASLGGFVILSEYINTVLGISWLVFVSALAGTSYSWQRNIKVTLALVVVAFAFQRFLGLNLQLI